MSQTSRLSSRPTSQQGLAYHFVGTSSDLVHKPGLSTGFDRQVAAFAAQPVIDELHGKTELETSDQDELVGTSADKMSTPDRLARSRPINEYDAISLMSEDSDDARSIPHDDFDEANDQSITVNEGLHQMRTSGTPQTSVSGSMGSPNNGSSSTEMPDKIRDQLEAWYTRHGRHTPPCATSGDPKNLYKSNKSGRTAHWVHKSGERMQVRMYDLEKVSPKTDKSRILIAQGPTHGPYIISYAPLGSGGDTGTPYKIWRGVEGKDKDGYELQASVRKVQQPTDKLPAKPKKPLKTPVQKSGILTDTISKPKFYGNQWYHADGTPKSNGVKNKANARVSATSAETPDATKKEQVQSNYDFRPSKRQKPSDESPAGYSSLLASFSGVAKDESGRPSPLQERSEQKAIPSVETDGDRLYEHIQNNAVFLLYPNDSPQPRVRLFKACDSVGKLFAQALAGEVFHRDSTAKVLSVRIGGQQKASAVVEGDEQDFEDLFKALSEAAHWVPTKSGFQGSCTVEVRSKS